MQQNLWEALYAVDAADPSTTQEPGIAALAASLTVYTRERYPIQWAMTQSNLGRMYIDRAQGDQGENVERALEGLSGALQVYTPEQYPLQWATTQGNLGDAYRVGWRASQPKPGAGAGLFREHASGLHARGVSRAMGQHAEQPRRRLW